MAVTSVLRVKVGPWGGTGGNTWDEGGGGGGYTGIRSITIAPTWCIEGFLVEYDDNGRSVQGALHGEKHHGTRETLDFPREFLTHVSGYHDNFVRSLSFRTNLKKTLGSSHNKIGTPFSCSVDGAGAIVGFSGNSGCFLDAISLYIAVWNPDRFYDAMRQQRVLAIRTTPLRLQHRKKLQKIMRIAAASFTTPVRWRPPAAPRLSSPPSPSPPPPSLLSSAASGRPQAPPLVSAVPPPPLLSPPPFADRHREPVRWRARRPFHRAALCASVRPDTSLSPKTSPLRSKKIQTACKKMAGSSSADSWDYFSHGESVGAFASLLRQLMQYLEYRQPPIFRGRKVRIMDRYSWSMEVFLYARDKEFDSHRYPIEHPRTSCFDAIQDAARLAIADLCQIHKDTLQQSPFCFFLTTRAGQSYREPFEIAADDPRLSHQVQLTQAMAVTCAMCGCGQHHVGETEEDPEEDPEERIILED